jgi:hypothetical protein
MKLIDIERLLGGERVIFYYTSEQWVDFRELVKRLAAEYHTRIEMHQVNAREEARLVADYERCGQRCCCRQFLKVLKPVSMKSAKIQKATLDPTKISGRCGRFMCCLRYEDQTYADLRARLPRKQARVLTADGPGTVIDTQILTQLALVRLDDQPALAAYPVEELEPLEAARDPLKNPQAAAELAAERAARREQASRKARQQEQADFAAPVSDIAADPSAAAPADQPEAQARPVEGGPKRRRRGGRRRGRGAAADESGPTRGNQADDREAPDTPASDTQGRDAEAQDTGDPAAPSPQGDQLSDQPEQTGRTRRRRRGGRRRRRRGGDGSGDGAGGGAAPSA